MYTVPLYKTLAHNYVVPDDILTNGVGVNYAKTTDQIAFYWFPAFHEVVVSNWTIVDVNTPGNAWTNDHVKLFKRSVLAIQSSNVIIIQVPSSYATFNKIATIGKEIIFGLTTSTCALANSLGMLYSVVLYNNRS